MTFKNTLSVLGRVVRVFAATTLVVFLLLLVAASYVIGYTQGLLEGQKTTQARYESAVPKLVSRLITEEPSVSPMPLPTQSQLRKVNWGGPELWEAVNIRRTELGVNKLIQKDGLCTIASIRLNELLELGKLDGHEGFSNLSERRPDLEPIINSYATLAEFLLSGAASPQEAVSLWENTLGHKKLLTGGEYVWGCIYAQNSFAVAITAF